MASKFGQKPPCQPIAMQKAENRKQIRQIPNLAHPRVPWHPKKCHGIFAVPDQKIRSCHGILGRATAFFGHGRHYGLRDRLRVAIFAFFGFLTWKWKMGTLAL